MTVKGLASGGTAELGNRPFEAHFLPQEKDLSFKHTADEPWRNQATKESHG